LFNQIIKEFHGEERVPASALEQIGSKLGAAGTVIGGGQSLNIVFRQRLEVQMFEQSIALKLGPVVVKGMSKFASG
jgi:hypothetical protein